MKEQTTFAAAVLVAAALAAPGAARAQDSQCLSAPVPPVSAAAQPLRFGITPLLAGSAGGAQGSVVAEDPAQAATALADLQPPGRRLVMRINRVFESDGQAGIDHAVGLVRQYAAAGFDVESQLRYHPDAAHDGDIDAWVAYVRRAAAALGAEPGLVALTITNEVNLPLSSNTSDGAFKNALDAIVRGTVAAREQLDAMGRTDVQLGFSYAYRYTPSADVSFWKGIGARATPAFRAATRFVGVQLYPGLFWPPVLTPGQTAGDATRDALALIRTCYMPLAGLGAATKLWITENGYPTNLGHDEARQVTDLRDTVEAVARYSGTLGVTDYRYFNLRDNRPNGTDLFDDVGLLRADYARKPAFATYRDLVARLGATPAPLTCRFGVRLPRGPRYARVVRASLDGARIDARLVHRRGLRDLVVITLPRGVHELRVRLRTVHGSTVRVTRRALHCEA